MHDITYTYDPVGNITNITNAATGADGLGGDFTYNYSYDELYRLAASSGGGKTDGDASYTLAMAYSPSGNILQKTLSATKQLLGNSTYDSYSNEYTYSGAHTLANVNDLQGGMPSLGFAFDGNGNMVTQQLYDPNSGLNERYLCWDEENRLSATRDYNYVTANIYDASGNRAWTLRRGSAQALAGEMNWMWQNGSGWQGYGDLNLRTWYQSELMTITDEGFTKHYFIAGQKIASKIGESLSASDETPPLKEGAPELIYGTYEEWGGVVGQRLRRDFECLGVNFDNFSPGQTFLQILDELNGAEQVREDNIYFYHSDHLGSSSFLTNLNGEATQHLQYLPFGEDLVHQQNTAAYYTPYTFSGKERDMETGLSYFGARYYDAGLSIWLSVDPLADHPNQVDKSPYAAFWNNPVIYTDPDGRCPDCPDPSTAIEGDIVNPNGGMSFVLTSGEYIGLGGTLPEVTITPSNDLDWGGVADASLGIVGGIFEVALGVAGEVFTSGVSTALIVDGAYRIGTNSIRLGAYLTDNERVGNALPNNIGSTVGKFYDGINGSRFYDVGI